MKKKYISKEANNLLLEYLKNKGYEIELVESIDIVNPGISCHPDIFMCKLGIYDNSPIIFANRNDLGLEYPKDIPYNAACTGRYFIHNIKYTSNNLLSKAKEMNLTLIPVKQGYAKCSILIVDETSLITYDKGIAKACSEYMDVLLISPGHIILEGYNEGFIGGASGRIDEEIVFNGDLSSHPDFKRIVDFVRSKGLSIKWFPEYPLTDIGSII